jgi:DnaJ-class molecular chaperone
MNSAQKDLYSVLGVSHKAEFAVIKAAYKALMMIHHPDRHPSNPEQAIKKTKDIIEAYNTLIDPNKRKRYDAQRENKLGKPTITQPTTFSTANELTITLKESEAILEILNDIGNTHTVLSELVEFRNLVKDTEALFKILNDPDL